MIILRTHIFLSLAITIHIMSIRWSNVNFTNPAGVRGLTTTKGDILCATADGKGIARLHVASDNMVLTSDSQASSGLKYKALVAGSGMTIVPTTDALTLSATGGGGGSGGGNSWVLAESKPLGHHGGTFTQDIWITRAVNVVLADGGSNCSISNDEFTLTTGRYLIEASAPAFQVASHRIRLFNVTADTNARDGTSEYSNGNQVSRSHLRTVVNVAAPAEVFRIEHRCERSKKDNGLGVFSGFGDTEIYTQLTITQQG